MHNPCLVPGLAGVALLAFGVGCSAHVNAPVTTATPAYQSDASTIQVVSAFVGANVYIPSTIAVVGGRAHTLSIFNATDQPHGFAIAGLGVETVLAPKQETVVELPALEGGHVYRIHCQMHGTHRSATLVVLPGRAR